MDVTIPIKKTLLQLSNTLEQLTANEYKQPCHQLSGASIGQHCRHIMELYQALLSGYDTGTVCYEQRKRDIILETNKEKAMIGIGVLMHAIQIPDKKLKLSFQLDHETDLDHTIETNYHRELMYNLEHSVHHMALIRIGINELTKLEIPASFGVASSTLKYRNSPCAQ